MLTGFGRAAASSERIAKRLPEPRAGHRARRHQRRAPRRAAPTGSREHVDGLDGVLHSIGFAPQGALGGNFLNTAWEDVATAVHVSAYSLKSLDRGRACR